MIQTTGDPPLPLLLLLLPLSPPSLVVVGFGGVGWDVNGTVVRGVGSNIVVVFSVGLGVVVIVVVVNGGGGDDVAIFGVGFNVMFGFSCNVVVCAGACDVVGSVGPMHINEDKDQVFELWVWVECGLGLWTKSRNQTHDSVRSLSR